MRIIYLIISLILLQSCVNNSENKLKKESENIPLKTNKSQLAKECIQKDTITDLGTSIKYIYSNGKYKISYSGKFYSKTYDSLYTCNYNKNDGLWDFVPKLHSETKSNLIFTNILWTSSGGNPEPLEYYAIVLPKSNSDKAYEKDFFISCMGNYLVYGDSKNEKIHITNLETKKTQLINLIPKPDLSRSPTSSILDTKIEKNVFSVKYQSLNRNDEIITVEKEFKIII